MATPKSKTARGHGASTRTPSRARSAGAGTAKAPSRSARTTTDHDEIQEWAEERGAHPACVKGTGRSAGDIGMIRLDFPGFSGAESLQPITWEEFFEAFEKNRLALVYQETRAGGEHSNFNKLVKRDATAADDEEDEDEEDDEEEEDEDER